MKKSLIVSFIVMGFGYIWFFAGILNLLYTPDILINPGREFVVFSAINGFPGIVITLIGHALIYTNNRKVCPHCAEYIKLAAKVCRYCGNGFYKE